MSVFAIKQYYSEVEKIIHYGGSKKETAIRTAFYNLLNVYADPYSLARIENCYDEKTEEVLERSRRAKLKANKDNGSIEIDAYTELKGIPAEAWEYKLGNRSALEWILDQYKEKKPKDPTIAEKFNNYHFVDYKEQVIDLLKRVCTVSVETMKIVGEME
jgi:predicted helicase